MSIVEVVLGSLDEYPLLLTIEEAGGRTANRAIARYDLARQYEASRGRSGLPVMRVGACLRVPRWALAELIATGRVVRLVDSVQNFGWSGAWMGGSRIEMRRRWVLSGRNMSTVEWRSRGRCWLRSIGMSCWRRERRSVCGLPRSLMSSG